jgi:hypothetical protein
MNDEQLRIMREQAARLTPEIRRQVSRRAGGRCEGYVDPSGREKWSERCRARGDALDYYVSFSAGMDDGPLTAADVHLLCEECYENSEDAEQQRHFDYLLSKDD